MKVVIGQSTASPRAATATIRHRRAATAASVAIAAASLSTVLMCVGSIVIPRPCRKSPSTGATTASVIAESSSTIDSHGRRRAHTAAPSTTPTDACAAIMASSGCDVYGAFTAS